MSNKKEDWITALELVPHPEGGFYKETYRSSVDYVVLKTEKVRSCATSIHFLLGSSDVSHFHEIQSDEIWNYHAGAGCVVHVFDTKGNYFSKTLGVDFDKGEVLQFVVPAGCIFASESKGDYSLVGCVVVPGFDFEDFRLYTTSELGARYPDKMQLIERFTKEKYS